VPGRPPFDRVRKGYEPAQVDAYATRLEQERADLDAVVALTQARVQDLQARLDRYEALEEELTRSVHLANQTGDAVIADAEARAADLLVAAEEEAERVVEEGRLRLAEEERSLDGLRMAVAAEATMLEDVERRLSVRISRAAAALVEIVDAPGGLGPFSQGTATLLEFAQLLQHTARSGTRVRVRFEVEDGVTVARVTAAPTPDPARAAPAPA
jgi:hypothetical protein